MTHTTMLRKTDVSVAPLADPREWDAFVERRPDGTFSHLSGWRDVIRPVMRQRAEYLEARTADGVLCGVLPLYRLRSPVFGTHYVSVPCLNDGGPIGTDEGVAALLAQSRRLAAGGRLELRSRSAPPGAIADDRKVTVLLPLPSEPGLLWGALPSKVRSQVRRPQKAGMTVRFGVDQLNVFHDVWSQNMRDLGTPVLPRSFFEAIASAFPERFTVGVVYSGEAAVAAGAGFTFGGEFEITWASALREYNRDAPNMLLYWEFMQHAIERGCTTFNFGRCTPGEGTHRFKLQWGGETVPLGWITNDPTTDSAGPGRLVRIASNVWQRLPLPVANTLGPIVARQLPWW